MTESSPCINPSIAGTFTRHLRGFGFVKPDSGEPDIFIPPNEADKCLNGDRVIVKTVFDPIKQKDYGEIVQVVEHTLRFVTGLYSDTTGHPYVKPDDPAIRTSVSIVDLPALPVQPASVVLVEIIDHGDHGGDMTGRIVEVLGARGSYKTEIASACVKYDIPFKSDTDLEPELADIPVAVEASETVGRKDLRHVTFFTIDGDDSKDFDDAVALVCEGECRKLLVAIADVSHYVKPASRIDQQAYARGTSVYFPALCLPMLPEKISNGICSLNPLVDRLALVGEISYGAEGDVVGTRFFEAVIHSKARLTYNGVDKFFKSGKLPDSDNIDVAASLAAMRVLAAQLRERRIKNGCIEFRSSEVRVELDVAGAPVSLVRQKTSESRQLIEVFMVAANEAVAKFLKEKKQEALYRVHEAPDGTKIDAVRDLLTTLGVTVSYSKKEKAEERMVTAVSGTVHEPLINEMLIRSMKQALYSHKCLGHYGLGLTHYLHFTSPIRRYPDLIVHRALKAALRIKGYSKDSLAPEDVPVAGLHLSSCERAAMQSENEIVRLKSCQFMDARRGRDYKAMVRGVTPNGLFVEIDNFPVSGFVHISQISDEYMEYDPDRYALVGADSGDVFSVGAKVDVKVKDINYDLKTIEFQVTYNYGQDEW